MDDVRWQKSSFSFCNSNCAEVAVLPGGVLVRDSKDPDGPRLHFTRGQWRDFIRSVKFTGRT